MESINTRTPADTHRLTLNGFAAFCTPDTFNEVAAELVEKAGPGIPQAETLETEPESQPETTPENVSTWTHTIHDDEAEKRIKAQHAALISGGVKVDSNRQLYETGTRMAAEGYSNQDRRKREHEARPLARDAAAKLVARVEAEKRRDVEISAAELGRSIDVNGKLKGAGFILGEPAVRGLIGRLKSPALGYVLGLRQRIVDEVRKGSEGSREQVQADKAMLAETLRRECSRYGDVALKLRTRGALGDCFAVVSPGYAPADAPEVLSQILAQLPADARGSYRYDPASTSWELQADVWTPTPVAKQAVGEAFRGYVQYSSRDNGTRGFHAGGGVELIACLNASTYTAASSSARRRHVGSILEDLAESLSVGTQAIETLVKAWGVTRAAVVEIPEGLALQEVVPDFYLSLLTDRRAHAELVGVLPGRSKEHAAKLAQAFHAERRVDDRIVRSDLAQGWTRYVQDLDPGIQHDAEQAIGAWLVNNRSPIEPATLQA